MKTNLRLVSPLFIVIAACAAPLIGCKRLAIDALDRATEAAFDEASDGGGDVRIGHLPADFPTDAPVDAKATVWEADRITLDDGSKGWTAVFLSDESPEQVLAFYDQRLKRIDVDAGASPDLSLLSKMQPPGATMQMNGLQKAQTARDPKGEVQTQTTTMFEFRTQGQIMVTTIHRDGPLLKADEKGTMIFLVVTPFGRPKS